MRGRHVGLIGAQQLTLLLNFLLAGSFMMFSVTAKLVQNIYYCFPHEWCFQIKSYFYLNTYVNGAASSSTAVYFGQREPARGQGCCCCCWFSSFRFFTLQTHLTLHCTGQRLMNWSTVWMNDWLACSVFWTWMLTTNIWKAAGVLRSTESSEMSCISR